MQRIPFSEGWAIAQEPGLPDPDDEDDDVFFEESPASPDPSSAATSVYEITASDVVSESSSIPTSGLPTPPPSAGPPVPIDVLVRTAAQRLQEAAPVAAPDAVPDTPNAALDAPDAVPDAPGAAPDAPGAAPDAPDTVPEAAVDAAPASDRAAIVTPPSTPLRRSARLAERAQRGEEVAARARPEEAVAHPRPRRGPQRVAKMSTGGVRWN